MAFGYPPGEDLATNAKPTRQAVDPHEHWRGRAANYRQLAQEALCPEARRVLDHLPQICAEMAKATAPVPTARTEDRWIHPNEVVREATAQRWRIRGAEYRALADSCESDDGRQGGL